MTKVDGIDEKMLEIISNAKNVKNMKNKKYVLERNKNVRRLSV